MTKALETNNKRWLALKAFLDSQGITKIAPWAEEVGIAASAIYNLQRGGSKNLSYPTLKAISEHHGVEMWQITGDKPEHSNLNGIYVTGHIQAGSFREALEWEKSDWYHINFPVNEEYKGKLKALEVRGESMNLVAPDGSVVIYIDIYDMDEPLQNGDIVVVYCFAGGEVEATLKEYKEADGQKWLWPKSSDPNFQTPIRMGDFVGRYDDVVVKGVVKGLYQKL